ncbi:MAG: DNA-3-methyladenine glycosylase I [Candidatus Hodarchaeota archaeon]
MSSSRDWVFRGGTKPTKDSQFFENMTRIIFQAGLSWKMISQKWPAFQDAFSKFDIGRVAKYTANDITKLLTNPAIVRNQQKIRATISNAQEFQKISKDSGSFRQYLDKLLQTEGLAYTLKDLQKRFSRLGPSSARMFLWSIGEDIPHPEE